VIRSFIKSAGGRRTNSDRWTRRYGFGQKNGIELAPEEAAGLSADDAWKQENLQLLVCGDTLICQLVKGFLQVTPLQSNVFSVPANGGYLVKPHLLKDNEAAKKLA